MWYIDGCAFKTEGEYRAGLEDKSLINELKREFDLTDAVDIKALYFKLKSYHFKTELGDKFDDQVYELYEKVKNGEITSSKDINKTKKASDIKKGRDKSAQKGGLDSLDEATRKKVIAEIKRHNRKRIILICSLMVVAFLSLGYYAVYYTMAARVDHKANVLSELKDIKFADILTVTQAPKKNYSPDVVIPDILDEYVALYNKNKNFIGWLKIDGMIIDYPVMQAKDNNFYLKHNFDGENDKNGCIFLDKDCDIVLGNTNFILYGHHMKSGKMFASLKNYADQKFCDEHKIIQFDTIYEKGKYEVMYAFRSHIYNSDEIVFKYYQFIDANSAEEFNSAMEEMAKLSLIETDVEAHYGDKLLTLSTCDYQEANGRFVVVAKKVD